MNDFDRTTAREDVAALINLIDQLVSTGGDAEAVSVYLHKDPAERRGNDYSVAETIECLTKKYKLDESQPPLECF